MTILLYVRRKEWPLVSVTVESSHRRVVRDDPVKGEESGQGYVEVIRQHIRLEGDLTHEQRDRIVHIAGRCPVHRTLQSTPVIEHTVEVVR